MSGYIYLASPYSHPDPYQREIRYLLTMKEMVRILKTKQAVYSPIVHCHELAKIEEMPKDADFWEAYNFTMLNQADELWILKLPGWRESVGCKAEFRYADQNGIPVRYITPEGEKDDYQTY